MTPGAPRWTTPSQTVGPYLHIGLPWSEGPFAAVAGTPAAIRLTGFVLDGAGDPVADAMIESWQADPDGGFTHADIAPDATNPQHPGFRGFGRCATDIDGRFAIVTLKPGPVAWPYDAGGLQAPHINVSVFARGLLNRLVTRWYFADEPGANTADPVLRSVEPDRRKTLLLEPTQGGYRIDVRIQGRSETVFFDL